MRRLLLIALHVSTVAAIAAALLGPGPKWLALLAFALWYILYAPIAIYGLPGLPLIPTELEVVPDGVPTTPASDDWAREVAARLAPHGFVPRARFRVRGNQAFDFAQRLDNSTTGEVATIMAGRRPVGDEGLTAPIRTVFFHTRFRDGGEVVTTNSHVASLSPKLPGQRSYRLPELDDPSILYSLHRRLVKHDGRQALPIVLGDDPLVWERKQHERSIATQLSHGLAVRDEQAGRLRPTLKGAFRSTWLFHPLLARFQDRRATKEAGAVLQATLRTAAA